MVESDCCSCGVGVALDFRRKRSEKVGDMLASGSRSTWLQYREYKRFRWAGSEERNLTRKVLYAGLRKLSTIHLSGEITKGKVKVWYNQGDTSERWIGSIFKGELEEENPVRKSVWKSGLEITRSWTETAEVGMKRRGVAEVGSTGLAAGCLEDTTERNWN